MLFLTTKLSYPRECLWYNSKAVHQGLPSHYGLAPDTAKEHSHSPRCSGVGTVHYRLCAVQTRDVQAYLVQMVVPKDDDLIPRVSR